MRLSHLAPVALPFALLLALLASLIASPRIHSKPQARVVSNAETSHIPTLAPVRVTALVAGDASPNRLQLTLASSAGTTIRSSWPWMRHELWMPYFSFAASSASKHGL